MADLPFIKKTTFDCLAPKESGDQSQSEWLIVQPVFEPSAVDTGARPPSAATSQRVGHPVIFGRAHWAALAALDGDEGARSVVRAQREHLLIVETDDEGIWRDIDTPSDLPPNREI